MSKFKTEPAVFAALAAAVITAASQVLQAAHGPGGWLAAVAVAAPLTAGLVVRFHVIPTATVRTLITDARSVAAALNAVADKADASIGDLPTI